MADKLKLNIDRSEIHPIRNNIFRRDDPVVHESYDEGLKVIAEGKVACLILAGGDASRLGANMPKGMFDPKIDDVHSIFELITLKIKKLEQLSREKFPDSPDLGRDRIVLLIMTNQENNAKVAEFFKVNGYFGYKTVAFFPQTHLPVIDEDGQIMLRAEDKILFAPNGNGSIFQSLMSSGLMGHIKSWGIDYLHVTGVDNILMKWADPKMVGLAVNTESDIIAKCTPKLHALERVGVFALTKGKPYVIEYSVIGDEMAKLTDETGELLYSQSNLLNLLYRVDFLEREILNEEFLHLMDEKYIVAIKDVKNYDLATKSEVSSKGCKFEIILQESLTYCHPNKFYLLECLRNEEFAPIKNSVKENFDNPETALTLYCGYHQSLLQKAGYEFAGRGRLPRKGGPRQDVFRPSSSVL